MPEPPPRKRFQIHLSTAIIVMAFVGCRCQSEDQSDDALSPLAQRWCIELREQIAAVVKKEDAEFMRMATAAYNLKPREEKTVALYAFVTSEHFKQLVEQVEAQAGKMLDLDSKEQEAHRRLWDARAKLIRSVQKARSDLTFEIDRIIGTAGNGPGDEEAA